MPAAAAPAPSLPPRSWTGPLADLLPLTTPPVAVPPPLLPCHQSTSSRSSSRTVGALGSELSTVNTSGGLGTGAGAEARGARGPGCGSARQEGLMSAGAAVRRRSVAAKLSLPLVPTTSATREGYNWRNWAPSSVCGAGGQGSAGQRTD